MRMFLRLILGLMPTVGMAQPQAPSTPVPPASPQAQASADDPLLQSLLREALDHNPEVAKAQALIQADRERVPQSKALPDPSLSLGLQNDGFKGLQIGKMETSYYQLMFTQPLPWPGKRALRGEVASTGAEITQVAAERVRLTLEADVKRSYFGLLLVRDQLQLLDDQALFLEQAQAITKARYEVGQGAQADLLRAQLERNRLNQGRQTLLAQERSYLATLNRLLGRTEASPLATTAHLDQIQVEASNVNQALARSEERSPELRSARLGVKQAERSLDLAKLDRRPDFAVSAGIMPRGGLDPMWQAGVSISLPLWSRQKQQRAVAEQEWRRKSQGSEVESVRNLLVQRVRERAAQMDSAQETLRIYRGGLIVQSEASFRATLAQYEAGRAPFLSVLEALNGWVADRGGLLQILAQAKALQVADEELNLAGTPAIQAQGLSAGSMGMGGSPSSGAAMPATSPKAPSSSGEAGTTMKSM